MHCLCHNLDKVTSIPRLDPTAPQWLDGRTWGISQGSQDLTEFFCSFPFFFPFLCCLALLSGTKESSERKQCHHVWTGWSCAWQFQASMGKDQSPAKRKMINTADCLQSRYRLTDRTDLWLLRRAGDGLGGWVNRCKLLLMQHTSQVVQW